MTICPYCALDAIACPCYLDELDALIARVNKLIEDLHAVSNYLDIAIKNHPGKRTI